MIYELAAYNTDSRYPDDVRYRAYTSSKRLADDFSHIPKIQFTDSGHGVVFSFREHSGRRLPERREVAQYVFLELQKIEEQRKITSKKESAHLKNLRNAAPDLYEALKMIMEWVEAGHINDGAKEMAYKALAKAEGKF